MFKGKAILIRQLEGQIPVVMACDDVNVPEDLSQENLNDYLETDPVTSEYYDKIKDVVTHFLEFNKAAFYINIVYNGSLVIATIKPDQVNLCKK